MILARQSIAPLPPPVHAADLNRLTRLSRCGLGLALSCAALGCDSDGHSETPSCGAPVPSFRVAVEAPPEGQLPGEFSVYVLFGGSREVSFSVDGSEHDTDVLCCQLFAGLGEILPVPECGLTVDSGVDAGPGSASAEGGGTSADAGQDPATAIRAVVCDLWTTGAAELRVESDGYPEVAESLTAQVDEACESSILVEQRFVLPSPVDGGP